VTRRRALRRWPRIACLLASCLVGLVTATTFAQQVDIAGSIAAENARFAAQLRTEQSALDRWSVELENLRVARRELTSGCNGSSDAQLSIRSVKSWRRH